MRFKVLLKVTFVVVVGLVIGNSAPCYSEPLKVGAVLPLTGMAQKWGQSARRAIELALEEVNENSPGGSSNISVTFEDSQSVSASGVTAYRKLVDRDGVSVVIGDVWAFLTMPLVPLAERDKVVLISPTVMKESVTATSPYFFTFGNTFEGLKPAIERFFELESGVHTVGTLSYEDMWNDAFLSLVAKVAKEKNVTVVRDLKLSDYGADFRPEVTTLRALKPDVVFATWGSDKVLRRMKEQKFSPVFLTSSDLVEAFRLRAPDAVLYEGAYFVDWPPSSDFRDKFRKKYGEEPIFEAVSSYEIIHTLARALKNPGSEIKDKLRTVSYEGAGGPIDFKAAPYVNLGKGRLFQVQKGEFVDRMR